MTWLEQATRWYGVLLALTVGWAPLVQLLCDGLPDRGASVVRPLALLGVVYPLWLLSSLDLLPYSSAGLWITLVVGAIVGWTWAIRDRRLSRSWLTSMLVAEIIAAASFAAYVWLRGYTPEILNTEKPMDSAFLAASTRADAMPPEDPWFAGEPINYYYLGYVLHGAVTRLAGVPSSVGFNLALATTFSMTVTAAAGLGFNAVRPWFSRRRAVVAGTLAAVLLALVGNLYAAKRFVEDPATTYETSWWQGIGWNASRVVYDRLSADQPREETINEFPYFSFLLGDLHPHLIALPYTQVALMLALNLLLQPARATTAPHRRWTTVAVTGAVVGSLYAINSWDYPTYLAVAIAALWVARRGAARRAWWIDLAVLTGASIVAWLPFFVTFAPLTGGRAAGLAADLDDLPIVGRLLALVGTVTWDHTSVGEFLTVFGVPYAIGLLFLGSRLLHPRVWNTLPRPSAAVAGALVVGCAVAILLPAPLLVVCGLPLLAAVILVARDPMPNPRTLATALIAAGLALVLLTEFFYVRDVFNSRFNTLFKVYYQAWTLFALATALACVALWREAWPRRIARPALWIVVGVALLAGAVYPAVATYRWTAEFGDWKGLDGAAYLGELDRGELEAIRWLRANATSDDVILEAASARCAYTGLSRVSSLTGVPTIIGWDNHERQWRSGQPDLLAEIAPRLEAVRTGYEEPSSEVLERYGVTLIIVGRLERERTGACSFHDPYPSTNNPSFPGDGWELAFASGDVNIFRRQESDA